MWQFEFYPDRELLCELGYMPRKRSISDPLPNKKDESIKLTVDSIYPFHSSIAFRKEFNKVMNAHGLLEYADTMLIIALIEDQQAVTYLELGKEASK